MTDPLSAAESKLGDPYEWAAAGPNAFDCSGLIQWAYQQAGIRLPRTSQEQRNAGTPISLAQAEPGDLITYSYPGESGNPTPGNHVGMFVSPGVMIDAPHTGADVRFDPIDTAHLDRVVHVGSGINGPASTVSADYLATSGIDPGSWPGTVMAGWNPLGDAAAGAVGSVLRAMGPMMLNFSSLLVGGSLVVLGLWRMTEPTRKAAEQKAQTAAKVAAVAAV